LNSDHNKVYKCVLGLFTDYTTNSMILMHLAQEQTHTKVRVMVFNATFNNISVILWRSDILMEETGKPSICCKSLTNFIK